MKKYIDRYMKQGKWVLFQVTNIPFVPIGNGGMPGTSGQFTSKLFAGTGNGTVDIGNILQVAFKMSLSIGAVLAVLRIAYSGYLYMGQADMWSSKQEAKDVFKGAIIGLLLLFGMWLILNQINPDILQLDIFRCLRSNGCPGTVLPGGVGAAPY